MPDTPLYDTDILAWSGQQAGALRQLAVRRDLPNELDLANVIEEIEDVGQSSLAAVEGFIRLILGHALKCVADPDAPGLGHWQAEIGNWQAELAGRFSPGMRRKLAVVPLWRRAIRQARLDLAAQGKDVSALWAGLALAETDCPLTIDDLLSDPPDPAALVARLCLALSPP